MATPTVIRPTETVRAFIESNALVDILRGPRREGKGQPVDAPVLTASGWVKIGDLSIGDRVVAGNGALSEIVGVYPRGVLPVWCLHFSDGASLDTTEDHLWRVETAWDREGGAAEDTRDRRGRKGVRRCGLRFRYVQRWRGPKIVSTQDIRDRVEAGAWRSGGRWSVPLVGPVQFPAQPIPLDPYVLGVLLGDGTFAPETVYLTTADREIADSVRGALPPGAALVQHHARYAYGVAGLMPILRELGLVGHRSWEKFVPPMYLWNVSAVRRAMLQGLLDTDGTVLAHSNSVSYSTTSPLLADDVVFLVRSLGGVAVVRTRQTTYESHGEVRAGRISYHVSVRLPNSEVPFRLARKAERVRPKGIRNAPRRYIVGVEPAGEAETVCIRVAHPSGLYVTRDFLVTHNTFGGYLKALHKAHQLPGHARPLRGACIRDTGVNLQRTAVQTLKELEQLGVTVEWRGPHDHRTGALIDWVVDVEFFGLDRMEEVNKLQGMGAGFFWLEEPAPAADISGGIPVEVFGVAVTSLQQAGVTEPWIQITMNPPDSDHWTMEIAQRLRESGLDGTARRRPLVKVWRIPPGENPHITAEQRGEWRAGLEASGRKDLVARLIEGRVGQIILGEAVMPEYHDEHHVAKVPLPILRDATIVRCYDFGLTPVVIETQITPMGRWHILWPFQRVNAGIKQLLEEEVIPWEAEYLRGFRGIFRDVGDHAGTQREQSNSETTAVKVLEELLHTTFEPGPIEWSARRQALKNVLDTMIRGEPKFVVDPDALAVRRALRAGWHYPKDGLGRITPTLEAAKRASGLHDHVGHALAHAASVLFPVEDTLRQRRPVRPVRRQAFGSGVERKELSWLGA